MRKWKPSKTKTKEFAQKMNDIQDFCDENGIDYSTTMDSFYFKIDKQNYRVSNHTIEQSNRKAFNFVGEQVRDKYHADSRSDDTVYITASKTRLIEIYEKLKSGKTLNKRGYII